MSAALQTGESTWHRLSPRMLLIHPVIEIGKALPALAGVFLAGSAQGNHYWGLIGAGVVAALALSRWFTTRLRVTPEHLQLRQGLLRRRTITTARDRIRTVDVTSHLLHRVLGLARVVVGTGTNDRKGEGRIVLDGLPFAVADALRDSLLHHRPGAAPEPVGLTKDSDRGTHELARLDRRWIRYAPFTLSGVLTGALVYGFLWRLQSEAGVDLTSWGPLRAVGETLRRMSMAGAVLVVLAAILVFVAVTSTLGYVLAFWNFRLVRHPSGTLEVTRGLITTRATSIERRRLVGVEVSEPLPLRAVGATRTLVVATGLRTGRGAERGGEVLLPPAPRAVAEAVASGALDGTPAITTALRPHGPAARRRRVTRALVGAGGVLAAGVVAASATSQAWPVVAGVLVVVLAVPLGLDRYAGLGHQLRDGHLVTRSGSLVRRRVVIDCHAVIGWNVRSTFWQRRLGLSTLTATTAAGRQGYQVADLATDDVILLADTAVPDLIAQFVVGRVASTPSHIVVS